MKHTPQKPTLLLFAGGFATSWQLKNPPPTPASTVTTFPTPHAKPPKTALLPPSSSTPARPIPSPTPKPKGEISHILEYHYIRAGVDQTADPLGFNLSITPTQLDTQIAALSAAGYTSETMADYSAGKGGTKTVVMTFDDGYEDFYTSAYPILKKYGWTATIYVISGDIGGPYMTWSQLRTLKDAGIEIGAHTVSHVNLANATIEQQTLQIQGSKATLESQTGATVTAFCYPSGKYTAETEALVKAAGFTSATTENPGGVTHGDDQFQLNRVRVRPTLSTTALLDLLKY